MNREKEMRKGKQLTEETFSEMKKQLISVHFKEYPE